MLISRNSKITMEMGIPYYGSLLQGPKASKKKSRKLWVKRLLLLYIRPQQVHVAKGNCVQAIGGFLDGLEVIIGFNASAASEDGAFGMGSSNFDGGVDHLPVWMASDHCMDCN